MTCIACKSDRVEAFLDLGQTALANKFLAAEELGKPEPHYPLVVGFCHDCGHVQLTQVVPPPEMYDDYLYISSASGTLVNHLHSLANVVAERQNLGVGDLWIDVGCNDGTLLSGVNGLGRGIKTLGVDPARNLRSLSEKAGIDVMVDYFGLKSAREIVARHGKASVVTATNVFLHIPVLDDFLAGLREVLKPGGMFVVEAHYLRDLLEQCAFDTVYHEHCSYWSLHAEKAMFERYGFEVVDVARLPIHHGQLRLFVQRKGEGVVQPSVERMLAEEKAMGLDRFETFQRFATQVATLKISLNQTVDRLLAEGKRVVAYGAPAKGMTLLTYLGITQDRVEWIADKSALKQGRFTPGTHIPVVSPQRLLDEKPDYCLLLAWNFAEEIMAEQSAYRAAGGKFILPVPEVKVV